MSLFLSKVSNVKQKEVEDDSEDLEAKKGDMEEKAKEKKKKPKKTKIKSESPEPLCVDDEFKDTQISQVT